MHVLLLKTISDWLLHYPLEKKPSVYQYCIYIIVTNKLVEKIIHFES